MAQWPDGFNVQCLAQPLKAMPPLSGTKSGKTQLPGCISQSTQATCESCSTGPQIASWKCSAGNNVRPATFRAWSTGENSKNHASPLALRTPDGPAKLDREIGGKATDCPCICNNQSRIRRIRSTKHHLTNHLTNHPTIIPSIVDWHLWISSSTPLSWPCQGRLASSVVVCFPVF